MQVTARITRNKEGLRYSVALDDDERWVRFVPWARKRALRVYISREQDRVASKLAAEHNINWALEL